MYRAFLALSATFALMSAAQAGPLRPDAIAGAARSAAAIHDIHGCHQTWARGPQGWHRHGPGCEARKGIVDQGKRHGKAKKSAT
jgi:hypothetical protein